MAHIHHALEARLQRELDPDLFMREDAPGRWSVWQVGKRDRLPHKIWDVQDRAGFPVDPGPWLVDEMKARDKWRATRGAGGIDGYLARLDQLAADRRDRGLRAMEFQAQEAVKAIEPYIRNGDPTGVSKLSFSGVDIPKRVLGPDGRPIGK